MRALSASRYRIADIVVDPRQRRVTRAGQELALGKLTFELFVVLAERAPDVVSQEELAERVWCGRLVTPETVAQRVKMLRQALGDDAKQPRYLRVVRGHGYQ
jgi:DNA-binding winged helix-turn-helix (wHTH) protein